MKYKLYVLLLCWAAYGVATAQNRYNYFTLGVQANVFNYFGDLNPTTNALSTNLSFTRPSLGIEASYKGTPNLHLRTALIWGRLRGDDFESANPNDDLAVFRYARNLHFRTDVFELSLVGQFDLKANRSRFYRRKNFVPYLFGGVALIYFDPRAKAPEAYGGNWVRLRPLHTEGQGKEGYSKPYSPISIAFPFGLGARFRLTDRLDLSFEMGLRYTLTDYLDDVGGFYPNPDDLDSDLARVMSNRSGEEFAAVSSTQRDIARINQVFGGLITYTGGNGFSYQTIPGYNAKGEIRGTKNVDVYLVTGFHLNYIFAIKRYRPYVPSN